ncbi:MULTISPECIES: multifunctional CCA addition/repair protein [unclassified Thalassolituus]|uniref:multifunctional CCA addition/repair protein n=1 Tax=unclassified Thalassolituus TaxID=2624967 RepID=UPI0007CF925B|nr:MULTISPECIES: multifunctional CCA addition/repair protein [unclassified Thalassolituus]KZY97944.1 multifunctional CCA tRNA nucleotidyl transferase/2'3'-cyclic phosphodiesterase/2'nucleotidase/phosphatase [Oleibacter sp. HI0075]MEC8908575.1 multifunctional CCA addition/repair protein [Pseudomonadota bacterium]HCG78676.1 multifunctional CCA addition/repair protein [Oceanospirillales bacterium]
MQTYLVGGAVRDHLLNRPVKDNDWVVVGATPEEMISKGYEQVGADFPVFLHPDTKEEYALARTERKSGKGYQGFVCDFSSAVTLEEDLLRRDLTINAMAQDSDGKIIDPYNGQTDLQNRILRHVSPAFQEDPLRVLRVARFAARFAGLGFRIADETMDLMKQMVVGNELDHLVAERVWTETQRSLGENSPDTYFRVLRECGALKVWFEELDALFGVPQPEKHHPEIDTGEHALLCLQAAQKLSDSTAVRWAALIHDLGKGRTPESEWPRHFGHEKKGLSPVKQLCNRLKAPNDAKTLALLSSEFHTHVHRAFELRPDTLLKLFDQVDAWRRPERFEDFLLVCIADARGRTGLEECDYPQAEYCRNALKEALTITAQDIIATGIQGAEIRPALAKARADHLKGWKSTLSI